MSTALANSQTEGGARGPRLQEMRVYSHSGMFYWWPVWAFGYLFAFLTWWQGKAVQFGDYEVLIHPSRNLGVLYTIVFLLVIYMTHIAVRGVASLTVIVSLIALSLLFAYLDWWDEIFRAFGNLAIFMNLGFYLFFSSAVFIVWAVSTFVVDRLDYYIFRPGQMVHYSVFGGGEQTFDTHGMSVVKMRDDMFRHWILGLGSGDLHIATTGARKTDFVVPNVLFVSNKLETIQELVAMKPDETPKNVIAAGTPL